MKAVAPAILYALFVWWFTTGLVLLLVMRRKATVSASLFGAALLFPVALYFLSVSSASAGVSNAYVAFTAAIVLWGTQEIAFLTGTITGPRPHPCPPAARGMARLRAALGAVLYHEASLLVSGAATLAVTWHSPNQIGALTFVVLWVMRVSAEINLFLGVPVLNDALMPPSIAYMRTYFRRAPVNAFFPLAVLVSVLGLGAVVAAAANPNVGTGEEVGYTLVAALLGLAILEHLFLLIPLPVDRLWRWATGNPWRETPMTPGRAQTCRTLPDKAAGGNEIERVAVTSP